MKQFIIIFISIFLFTSCNKTKSTNLKLEEEINFDLIQKEYLYSLFKNEYYWANNISIDKSNFSSYETANDMINDYKYTLDRWSYSQSLSSYLNQANQKTSGFGCLFFDFPRVVFTRIGSPCHEAGIQRGDEILYINGVSSSGIYNETQKNLNTQVEFTIKRNNEERKILITPKEYSYTVLANKIINFNNKKIGFIRYDSFTSASSSEIEETFTYFKNNNIEELIIDLRYNGGGSISIASIFLDKIASYNNEDRLQFELRWNEQNSVNNSEYRFPKVSDSNSLTNISRIFFLTTSSTASASELMINALKPYKEVIVIGKRTHGKPVGMQGKINNNLIYWLINFETFNVNNEGGYFDGIDANCYVEDDINFLIGDIEEPMLKKALDYMQNESCF